jgi:hypothetical protein
MSKSDSDSPAKIRALNDAFRRTFVGGAVVLTAGVAAMPAELRRSLLRKVREFEAVDEDNDPHGEHDLGVVEIGGIRYFWKIDYYVRITGIASGSGGQLPDRSRIARAASRMACGPFVTL